MVAILDLSATPISFTEQLECPATASLADLHDLIVHAAGAGERGSEPTSSRGTGAVMVVTTAAQRPALVTHLLRVASNAGREAIASTTASATDGWRDLAIQVGFRFDPKRDTNPGRWLSLVQSRVLVVCENAVSGGGAVFRSVLADAASDPRNDILLVVLTSDLPSQQSSIGAPDANRTPLVLTEFDETDLQLWWHTVTQEAALSNPRSGAGLAHLERWWATIQSTPDAFTPPEHRATPEARTTWRMLHATHYPLCTNHAQQVAAEAVALCQGAQHAPARAATEIVDELLRRGLAARVTDRLTMRGEATPCLDAAESRALAKVLATVDEPWAQMRAVELLVDGLNPALGLLEEGQHIEALAVGAIASVDDRSVRDDLWQRWIAVLDGMAGATEVGDGPKIEWWKRSAEQALLLGDGDRAHQLASRALALGGDVFGVLLLHGRSCHQRGDLTTAAMSLSRALGVAENATDRARGAALMAEVRFAAGNREQARRFSAKAIRTLQDEANPAATGVRLAARNVLGKLLLAEECWDEAEEHFARDAYDASITGLLEEELRARLNRAIALLYLGRREQAQSMVEAVLSEGETKRVPSAVAFALSNLATIAILDQRYVDALALSERAIDVRYSIGSRLGMIRSIGNLAELRVRVGMVDEAELALRFGARACGASVSSSRRAFFAKAEVRIFLERGDSARARRAAEEALAAAKCIGEQSVLAQCHRLVARVALEDGDFTLAQDALERAAGLRQSSHGKAEAAVLATAAARAAGAPFEALAEGALSAARSADDLENVRDARLLLFHARKGANDHDGAFRHLEAACSTQDRVAASLPPDLRAKYTARRCCTRLEALRSQWMAPERDAMTRNPTGQSGALHSRSGRREPLGQSTSPGSRQLIGESDTMQVLRATIARVAPSETSVLIQGETGTGKELVAEAIHRDSHRREAALVKVNCAALVETLLLSELFGHEKGAFTGAATRRQGRFELADGGTLFLDEIGDISPRTQAALLRILQEGTYERVGGSTTLRADVRIICATHRDLHAMVQQGEFREDLYYRLCGITVAVPPLRDRRGDMGPLCDHLLQDLCARSGLEPRRMARTAAAMLSRHDWPGNIRELENTLRAAALFSQGDVIQSEDLARHISTLNQDANGPVSCATPTGSARSDMAPSSGSRSSRSSQLPPASTAPGRIDGLAGDRGSSADMVYAQIRDGIGLADMKRKIERDCIERALMEAAGNITRAAGLLGMKRPRLSQLVKQYGLATVLEEIKS